MTSLAASAIKRILNLKVITKVPLRIVLIFLNVLAIVAPLPSHALARVRAEAQRADIVPLAKEIDRNLGDSALTGGIQGLAVRSLRDGMTWYERNPDLYFMLASNQKLLTSAAALHVLGPEFRYRTRLLHDDGAGRASELAGNIYIEGSGDATLEEKDLDSFVSAVKIAGFRRIRGKIIGDGS